MPFLSPWLLSGLVLASVPVIIHLLNRRRFVVVDWAPMHYLQLTLKSNRRRLKLEQWLLLALRVLLVMLLFMAVARPTVSSESAAAWLTGRDRADRVIVLDDSLSMGYQSAGRSAFDRAKTTLATMIERIGAQDSVTVILTSRPDRPLVSQAHLTDPTQLLQVIADVQVSHTASNWPGVFEAVNTQLEAAAFPQREVTVLTDLRAEGWSDEVADIAKGWEDDNVRITIVDTGVRDGVNLALIDLTLDEPIALRGKTTKLTAVVRNDQADAIAGAQATLTIDGEARSVVLPTLDPGGVGHIPLSARFDEGGPHVVTFRLADDLLQQDNERSLAIDVRPQLAITLVDGEPDSRPFEGETDFLALALSVSDVPWSVSRPVDSEWMATVMGDPDVVVLANVGAISPARAEQLEERVAAGMGVIIFPGEQLDIGAWNSLLYRDGAGLLPVRLEAVVPEPVEGIVAEKLEGSALTLLERIAPAALSRITAKQHMLVGEPPADSENVSVLARWNTEDKRPAVIEKRIGEGRVLLWTLPADKSWSAWAIDPVYIVGVPEAALRVARGAAAQWNLDAGEVINLPVPAPGGATDATITVPRNEAPQAIAITRDGNEQQTIRFDDTGQAGVYSMSYRAADASLRAHVFSANPAARESDLDPVDIASLQDWLAPAQPRIIGHSQLNEALAGVDSEFWRPLITAFLLLLMVESVFALWVGRQR